MSLHLTLDCRIRKLTPRNYFKWTAHSLIVKALNCSADCSSYVRRCQKGTLSKHFLVILRNLCPCCLILTSLWIAEPSKKKLKTDCPTLHSVLLK